MPNRRGGESKLPAKAVSGEQKGVRRGEGVATLVAVVDIIIAATFLQILHFRWNSFDSSGAGILTRRMLSLVSTI